MHKRRIDALTKELQSIAKEMPAFKEYKFSVFDIDDMKGKMAAGVSLPVVAVTYDGAGPKVPDQGEPKSKSSFGASLIVLQFSYILAVQYDFSGQEDTKVQATDLLDDLRNRVAGQIRSNNRPWVFVGEKPERDVSEDGMVFYSQVWQTTVAVVGRPNQS